MIKMLLWDPRTPTAPPIEFDAPEELASAMVRAGVGAPRDPALAGSLAAGDPVVATDVTTLVLTQPLFVTIRIPVPSAVASVAMALGIGAPAQPGTVPPGPPSAPDITGNLADAHAGVAYTGTLTIAGGVGPFSVDLLGAPAGITAGAAGRTVTISAEFADADTDSTATFDVTVADLTTGLSTTESRSLLILANLEPPVEIATITPGAGWTGVLGSGGAVPVASSTAYIFGAPNANDALLQATAQMMVGDDDWVEDGQCITAIGGTAAVGFVDYVEAGIEGSDPVRLPLAINPQNGLQGWQFKVAAPEGLYGDAAVWIRVVPKNGLERVYSKRITLRGDYAMPTRYVSTTGSDAANGQSVGTAYATIDKALKDVALAAGGIIQLSAGDHQWTYAGGVKTNTRQIIIEGAGRNLTTIKALNAASGNTTFRWNTRFLRFSSTVNIDLSGLDFVYGNSDGGASCHIDGTKLYDPLVSLDQLDKGYPKGKWYLDFGPGGYNNQFWRDNEKQRWTFSDIADLNLLNLTCAHTAWNVSGTVGCDARFINRLGHWGWNNVELSQHTLGWEDRVHSTVDVTIASINWDGTKTKMTFESGPTFQTSGVPAFNVWLRVVESANAVTAGDVAYNQSPDGSRILPWQGYELYYSASDPTNTPQEGLKRGELMTKTNLVALGVQVGDKVRGFIQGHGDAGQVNPANRDDENRENFTFLNVSMLSHSWQPWLFQEGGVSADGVSVSVGSPTITGTTISTVGTAVTFSTAMSSAISKVHNLLILTSGPNSGEARFIKSIDSATTATLYEPFPADVAAGTSIAVRRSINGWTSINEINHKAGANSELAQFEVSLRNFGSYYTSVPGARAVDNVSILIRPIGTKGSNGWPGVVWKDSIIRGIATDAPGGLDPLPISLVNCHVETPGSHGQGTGNVYGGTLTGPDSQHYLPDGNLTETVTEVIWPWDRNGNPRTVGSKIGAVVA